MNTELMFDACVRKMFLIVMVSLTFYPDTDCLFTVCVCVCVCLCTCVVVGGETVKQQALPGCGDSHVQSSPRHEGHPAR